MKAFKALSITVFLLLLACVEGRPVESMVDPSGSSKSRSCETGCELALHRCAFYRYVSGIFLFLIGQLGISAWPPEDEDDVVGFCSEWGNTFALEMTCGAPMCDMNNLDNAVTPRLFFNDADIRKAAQVELGQSENFPSNCSKQWTMSISLIAGESAIVHCSQQEGRATSKHIVLQSGGFSFLSQLHIVIDA